MKKRDPMQIGQRQTIPDMYLWCMQVLSHVQLKCAFLEVVFPMHRKFLEIGAALKTRGGRWPS